jgi:hypothetical protein
MTGAKSVSRPEREEQCNFGTSTLQGLRGNTNTLYGNQNQMGQMGEQMAEQMGENLFAVPNREQQTVVGSFHFLGANLRSSAENNARCTTMEIFFCRPRRHVTHHTCVAPSQLAGQTSRPSTTPYGPGGQVHRSGLFPPCRATHSVRSCPLGRRSPPCRLPVELHSAGEDVPLGYEALEVLHPCLGMRPSGTSTVPHWQGAAFPVIDAVGSRSSPHPRGNTKVHAEAMGKPGDNRVDQGMGPRQ